MIVVDVHNHYMPEAIARALGAVPGKPFTQMEGNIPKRLIHDRQYLVDKRLSVIEKAGITVQLVSCPVGWESSIKECRAINDHLADLQKQHRGKLIGYAHVPLGEAGSETAVIEELHRAVDQLGLRGVSIPSQPFGTPMDDKKFWPFYKEVESMKLGIFIHPTPVPKGFDALAKYDLHRMVGREFDLASTICRIVFGGVLDAFPNLRLVFSHFGGGISALLERIEPRGKRWGQMDSSHSFMEYVKKIYIDTAGYTGGMHAFKLAYEVLGPSQLVFGSDYPQDFTEGEEIRAYVDRLKEYLPQKDFEDILGNNAARLFGLNGLV